MLTLSNLVFAGGLVHFSILAASFSVPRIFDWRKELAPLNPFLKHLFWVYGAFIVLVIVGFGAISVTQAEALAAGSPLARTVSLFIAVFWLARLVVQLFLFDIRPYVTHPLLRLGYHGLTALFTLLTLAYGFVALGPR